MMIAFENRMPDPYMLEKLLKESAKQRENAGPNTAAVAGSTPIGSSPSATSDDDTFPYSMMDTSANDRIIAAYDDSRLVGFGRLVASSASASADPASSSSPYDGEEQPTTSFVVLTDDGHRDLIPTITKLLHARKYVRSHHTI
ncbi:hypothetical protein [Paenibacillus koleovorans]|uniref:hypothetical protein n=1 Tax=Paenibacillus koleovorans TaxID=121608 RepID=UPI000FD7E97F|nr:hypothetical protein [Paenibacillus koleovorans]